MDDLISRQAAIDALCKQCTVDRPETCSTIQKGDKWCEEVYTLLKLPSAQPEIIRCKDCNYYFYDANFAKSWCNRMSGTFMVKPDSYCSFAVKRKENR